MSTDPAQQPTHPSGLTVEPIPRGLLCIAAGEIHPHHVPGPYGYGCARCHAWTEEETDE